MGIEALSRGASYALLVDKERNAISTIKANLQFTRLADKAKVTLLDAFDLLKSNHEKQYDYIYIAPPQYHDLWRKALTDLDANPGWLAKDGWVIIQIDPIEYTEVILKHITEFDKRRYGNTLLVFYR